MLNLLLDGSGAGNSWWIYIILLVAVVFLLVFPMFTQKKRNKEYGEMVNGLSVGDEVRTIGGIIGKIVKINKEQGVTKSIVIESGNNGSKTTLEVDVSCISYILNQVNPPKKEEDKKVEDKKAETKTEAEADKNAKTEVETEKEPVQDAQTQPETKPVEDKTTTAKSTTKNSTKTKKSSKK